MNRTTYQKRTAEKVCRYFQTHERGRICWPCGSGKTRLAKLVLEAMNAMRRLIAAPSLGLIRQLVTEIRDSEISVMAVCSAKDLETYRNAVGELQASGVIVTTEAKEVKKFLANNRRCLVLTTYRSAVCLDGLQFDIAIMDEAHHLAGNANKVAGILLHDDRIEIGKRLFMTATERWFAGNVSDKVLSMDDAQLFGESIDFVSFAKAIEWGWISDYQILLMQVSKEELRKKLKENENIRLAAAGVALQKAFDQFGIKHAMSVHKRVSEAKAILPLVSVSGYHVNGSYSSALRQSMMALFEKSESAVISHAGCLGEGVDVPSMDAVIFAAPLASPIEVNQNVGRVLRTHPGKQQAYVILPMVLGQSCQYADAFASIRALASMDERIVSYFMEPRNASGGSGNEVFEVVNLQGIREQISDDIRLELVQKMRGLRQYFTYAEASAFCQQHGIKTRRQYNAFQKDHPRLPSTPQQYYRSEWISWPHFLRGEMPKNWFTYAEASAFCQQHGIRTQRQYFAFQKDHPRLPSNPNIFYKSEWISWPHFLRGEMPEMPFEFFTYAEASAFCQRHGIKTRRQYKAFQKDHPRLPSAPQQYYRSEWISWRHFLRGETPIAFFTYAEASAFCQQHGIRTCIQYKAFQKDHPRLPSNPYMYYRSEWISWPHFLGTNKS